MTDEERQRQMDFMLEQQSLFAANIQQLAESNKAADVRLTRVENSLTALLAVGEMHEQELNKLRAAGKATDDRLNVLIGVVEQIISGGRNGRT